MIKVFLQGLHQQEGFGISSVNGPSQERFSLFFQANPEIRNRENRRLLPRSEQGFRISEPGTEHIAIPTLHDWSSSALEFKPTTRQSWRGAHNNDHLTTTAIFRISRLGGLEKVCPPH
ncbi:hypothetical protein TNCV_884321 [Trichonephila clavipes]|nr:hypothetical protein TNCV_884321 [Trichonephila clavipes]